MDAATKATVAKFLHMILCFKDCKYYAAGGGIEPPKSNRTDSNRLFT